MAKPRNTNGARDTSGDIDNQSLLARQTLAELASPTINIRQPSIKESFELNSSLCVRGSETGSLPKLHQAIRENKVAFVRQYSQVRQNLDVVDGTGFTPLQHAARANRHEVITMLLDCQADVNFQNQEQLTALHVAVRYNSLEAVKILLEHNADQSIKNTDGATPLHFAARRGCQDIVNVLLSNVQCSVNSPDNSGVTPFHLACVSGNLELFELFLEHEADICARTVEEKTPLHLAAFHGNTDIVQLLIKGASEEFDNIAYYLNTLDFEENTALHLACHKGHVSTAELLLRHGADVAEGAQDWSRHTPLHLAATNGHMAVVALLMSHGALVDSRDEMQRTPLHRAAEFDRVDVVKHLLKMEADIDAKDNEDRTPFLFAVKYGRTNTAELLLGSGADMTSRDESLRTCVHLSVQYQRMDTLRMLLKRDKAKLIDKGDKDLRTPLHYACHLGYLKIVQTLLEKNCAVGPKDAFERSPLHAAAANGHVTCVELLCFSEPGHINDKDERGLTPLHLAARERHRKTCALLLHMGAFPYIRDSNRWIALHHSAAVGCRQTAEILLRHHATLMTEATDKEGNNALHLAAKYGHVAIVELLVSRGADVTACNNRKLTCLDVAIECGKEGVAEVLIRNDKWMDILQTRTSSGINSMENLIQNMPDVAKAVMDRCVSYSDFPPNDPEYSVTFDLRLLDNSMNDDADLGGNSPRFFGPATMVDFQREKLLTHPLTQALLQWKWHTMGNLLFWFNFLTYFCFVCLLTTFVVWERRKQSLFRPDQVNATLEDDKIFKLRDSFSTGTPIVIVMFVCLHMLKELYQMRIKQWRYFTHLTNYIEWSCYISSLMFMYPYLKGKNIWRDSMGLWPFASVVILLSYTSLVLFLRRFTFFGIYLSMFIEVLRTFVKVLIIFVPVLLAFSVTFYLLLKEQASFSNLPWSLLKTTIMMIGEIDYGTIIVESKDELSDESGAPLVPIPWFTAVIVYLFCMAVSVLLMNLLVGLAVGDIDTIQKNANMRRLALQVEFVTDVNERYPRMLRKYFQRPVLVVKPNQGGVINTVLRRNVDIFSKQETSTDEGSNKDGDEEGENRLDKVSQEEALEQRNQMTMLQATVDEQSRLLKELSQQLKQIASHRESGESSTLLETGL